MIDYGSEQYLAALAVARVQKPRNATDMQAAELMYFATKMFWYSQVKGWAANPPSWAPATWQAACQTLTDLVGQGYDAEHQTWWYMGGMSKQEQAAALLLLMDFGQMVKQVRARSFTVIPASLDVVIDLICGRNWERRFAAWCAKATKPA